MIQFYKKWGQSLMTTVEGHSKGRTLFFLYPNSESKEDSFELDYDCENWNSAYATDFSGQYITVKFIDGVIPTEFSYMDTRGVKFFNPKKVNCRKLKPIKSVLDPIPDSEESP